MTTLDSAIPSTSHTNHLNFQKQEQIRIGIRRIYFTRKVLLWLPWVGLALQGLLAKSYEDWFCALLASLGSFIIIFDAFRPIRLYRYPLSTLVLLGFATTLQLGPLLFTALEGNSITYNLVVPTITFGHSLATSFVCVIAHFFYRNFLLYEQIRKSLQGLLIRLGIFRPLRPSQIIFMSSFGIFALAVSSWFGDVFDNQSIFIKLIEGFQFLSILPAVFLLGPLIGGEERFVSRQSIKPLLFFLFFIFLTLLVSVGRNSRGSFVVPLACLFLGLALQWLYGFIQIRRVSFIAFLLSVLLLLPILTDLASAMVMVRVLRSDISPIELASKTIDQLKDRQEIQEFREASANFDLLSNWSENYVSNPFLARFANAKFPDNSLYNAPQINSLNASRFTAFQLWRVVSLLPNPILSLFGVSESIKNNVTTLSIGDMHFFLASGYKFALGGFRTGHLFGSGMTSFGYVYFFLLGLSLLLIFPLIDSHASLASNFSVVSPVISVLAITQLISWFTLSNSESVIDLLSYLIRGFIQPILLFSFLRRLVPS